jgi:hypothetical protein
MYEQGAQAHKEETPGTIQEFDRLMRAIRDQTRDYPQLALEDIFDYLDVIEKRYGIEDSGD